MPDWKRILAFLLSCLTIGCQSENAKRTTLSFDNYSVADGFQIQLAAAEPLIEAPVTIDFDNEGRMWVVEMRGYMPNLNGAGEDEPNGRISIVEDLDGDGVADHVTPFLDSLVLPRAIAHVYGGLLYAVPPNLWFVEIENDRPGKKTLVDSLYSVGGNVEQQPNGLMMNIDNWIYNANSNFRYRYKDGKWLKESTSFRGQWGISKDNYGRLYYNYNEMQIAGDYVLPNTVINNPYLRPAAAVNQSLTANQRVYPLHATTVNRGAEEGILTKDSLLVNVTAACGPLIYRGGQFPDDYMHNAFICEPEANLVKRNILAFSSLKTTAAQAWDDREFLASTDEGFRPVDLSGGPDGALYVVDMHRGVVQHRAFATPYYRNGIAQKRLDTLLRAGRILRIKNNDKPLGKIPELLNARGSELVGLLTDSNGWVRDRAQQLLIQRQEQAVVPALESLLQDGADEIAAMHALYTLEGLGALSFEGLETVAASKNPMLSAHALLLLRQQGGNAQVTDMEKLATNLMSRRDTVVNLYLAASLGAWIPTSPETFLPLLAKLSQTYTGSAVFQEAIVSSLKGFEEDFQQHLKNQEPGADSDAPVNDLLHQTLVNKRNGKMNAIFVERIRPTDRRTRGLTIFQSTCMACHGADGEGMANIAPPLKGSPYVEGPPDRLALIILNGLKRSALTADEPRPFNGTMPNFGNNFSDEEIRDVIEYVRNSFVAKPTGTIDADRIKKLRKKKTEPLTREELGVR